MLELNKKQNEINDLAVLDSFRYENLFNVNIDNTDHYFYNILAKINFPKDIDETYYDTFTVPNDNLPYTFISYKIYGTTLLWWLICSINNINNPVYFPAAGTQLKILKPSYVRGVLQAFSQ